jgi:ElaB/YqjD/DUF883 family membrane-anchored ribosome-binding protein
MAARNHHSENPVTDRAAAMAHDTVDRVAEVANEAEQEVRSAAARKAKQARALQEEALEAVNEKIGNVGSYIKAKPFVAAGIAFAVGAIVSALLRR